MPSRPTVTLTTDFGTNDHFVGAMKGVILEIVPDAQIVDISHAVQPFDVLDGALTISQAYSYFPSSTVHLVVVDPGVGTARRPIIAISDKYYFVAPDNGVLSLVYAQEERMHVRHISSDHYFLQPVSNTFHARDIFAPVAAYLAKQVDSHKFGDEIQDFTRFAAPKPKVVDANRMRAVILKVDRFGNLITNITPKDAPMLFGADPAPFKLRRGQQRDYGNPHTLRRRRRRRSVRHHGQHGLPRNRRQPWQRRTDYRRRQGQRGKHHPGRGRGGGKERVERHSILHHGVTEARRRHLRFVFSVPLRLRG